MIGEISFGDQFRETHIRFRNVDDFESYINATDERYKAEDSVFNGYDYKIIIPHFKIVEEVIMVMVVILNKNLWNIEVILVL